MEALTEAYDGVEAIDVEGDMEVSVEGGHGGECGGLS